MQSSIDEYDEVSEQMSELSDTDSILENTEDCEESETASAVEESPESREISTRSVRKVYLITYRQAELERFPTREAFANTVWRLLTLPRVECMMFCIGYAVKKPILQAADIIICRLKFPIHVVGCEYDITSMRSMGSKSISREITPIIKARGNDTTKEDNEFLQSPNHPDLANSKPPQTLQASQSVIESGRKLGKGARKRKRARLRIYDVSQLCWCQRH